jgi:predicted DCC family thiol-disulfide oxidoreductase YuxK
MDHLLFYDGQCGLCDKAVQFVLRHDTDERFAFAPLQGETARTVLNNLTPEQKSLDTLILVENYKTPDEKMYFLGKGALRVAWLLGGKWKGIGWMNYLPAPIVDLGYRAVAKNRHRFFDNSCVVPNPSTQHRFLP